MVNVPDELEERLSIRLVEAAECTDIVLQNRWNANPPAKKGPDVTDDNEALPMSDTPRISFSVDLPLVDLLSFEGRSTEYGKFMLQFQICLAEGAYDSGRRLL